MKLPFELDGEDSLKDVNYDICAYLLEFKMFSSKIQTRDAKSASGDCVIIRTRLMYRTLWHFLLKENAGRLQ